jgi:Type III restriction enzyme, res subunit
MPELDNPQLWEVQATAIRNLEVSLREDCPQALIQMATGSGKTFTAANPDEFSRQGTAILGRGVSGHGRRRCRPAHRALPWALEGPRIPGVDPDAAAAMARGRTGQRRRHRAGLHHRARALHASTARCMSLLKQAKQHS